MQVGWPTTSQAKKPRSLVPQPPLLRGFLIAIINTTFLTLSITTYVTNCFFPCLILGLNLLHLCCKSDQSIPIPKSFGLIDVYYTSLWYNQSSENSSNGNNTVLKCLRTRQTIFSSLQRLKTTRYVWVKRCPSKLKRRLPKCLTTWCSAYSDWVDLCTGIQCVIT